MTLPIPDVALDDRLGFVGTAGSGKSYAAMGRIERLLATLLPAYPDGVDREVISDTTGYKQSTRDAYIQRLSTRELVDVSHGTVRASEDLFA